MYPSGEDIKELHKRHALTEKAFGRVFEHCQIVCEIAEQLMAKSTLSVDRDLVIAGALLHDIGAYRFIDKEDNFDEKNYLRHGVEGYAILKQEGLPEKLCRIAEHHTGVGITKGEIERSNLPLPPKDYLAESIEERIVMYADKFHSKHPSFNAFDSYCTYIERFGKEKVEQFKHLAEEFGKPDLEQLAKKYNQQII